MGKTLVYHGPPVRSIALDREIEDGDEFDVPDKAVADALLCAAGFSVKGQSTSDAGPKLPTKQDLIDQAEFLGLAVYAADTKESLAARIRGAGADLDKAKG